MPEYIEFKPTYCTQCGKQPIAGKFETMVRKNETAPPPEYLCADCCQKLLENATPLDLDKPLPPEMLESIRRREERARTLEELKKRN